MRPKVLFVMDSLIILSVLALVAVLSTGCSSFSLGDQGKLSRLNSGEWKLTSLSAQGKPVAIPDGKITLTISSDKKASGSGGCNRYSGEAVADEQGNLKFGALVSTKMYCQETMQAETAYFSTLGQVALYKFDGSKLILTSADGQNQAVFTK